MTVSSTTNRVVYTGNGVTTAFAVSFPFFATSDLVVVETTIATGAEAVKTLGTHYTVSGSTDSNGVYSSGGTVNAVTAPPSTVRWTIYRDLPRTQLVSIVDNDPLPAFSLMGPLDRGVMLVQRLYDLITRSLVQPEGDSATIGKLPGAAARANRFLAFDEDGDPIASAGTVGEVPATPFGESLMQADDAAEAQTLLGLGSLNTVPTGTIIDFGGTSAPTGYLGCDGSAVSRTTYAALFTAIGTTWGVGDGSTTFNLPNFQRRVAVGSGGSGTGTLGNAVGNTGGAETHTLTEAQLAAHDHGVGSLATASGGAHSHTVPYKSADAGGFTAIEDATDASASGRTETTSTASAHTHTISGDTGSAGSGDAHNNMQPSAVVLKCIKT